MGPQCKARSRGFLPPACICAGSDVVPGWALAHQLGRRKVLTVLAWRYIAAMPNRPLGTPCLRCLRVSCCNWWGPVALSPTLERQAHLPDPPCQPARVMSSAHNCKQHRVTLFLPVIPVPQAASWYQLQAPLVLHAYHGMGTNCASCADVRSRQTRVACMCTSGRSFNSYKGGC